MNRSLSHLRRALFAVSCAIVFGFGARQALAKPSEADFLSCSPELGQGDEYCNAWCIQQGAIGGGCSIRYHQCMCLYP